MWSLACRHYQKFSWLFCFAASLFISLNSPAQAKEIESLKKNPIKSTDTTWIDRYNQFSEQFIQNGKKDSALLYAEKAMTEAKANHYIHGMAVALSLQAKIAKHFDDDFAKVEKLGKASLYWYEKTGNKEGIDMAFFLLHDALNAQSKFEETIGYIKMYYAISKDRNDKNQMVEALNLLFVHDLHTGNYEKGFLYLERLHEMAIKEKNKFWLADSWWGLGILYRTIEDFTTALRYYRQVYYQYQTDEAYQKKLFNNDVDIWLKMELAEIFSQLHQFDSAWYYYRLFRPEKSVYQRIYWISTGECLLLQKQYAAALQNFYLGLTEHQKLNDRNEIKRALLDIGKTYLALGNLEKAKEFGAQGLHLALQTKSKHFIRDGYQILASVYDKQHRTDSANHYFRLSVTMKDEVLSDQAKGRIAAYQYEQKIALANKEIGLRASQLKDEIFEKRVLTVGLALLLILVVIIVRNIALKRRNEKQRLQHELDVQQLESEQTKVRLQQQATELEMQALRAQMNPHFIFNSLNSINNFILQNNKLQASAYLTKFSRLIRLILQNSQAAFIPLESELEALKLYLELEALRFDHHFDYHITVDGDLDTTVVKVPPLVIQPYVENAIWHGLMHKKEKGHLAVDISQQEHLLFYTITDNGIGRKKAAEQKNRTAATHQSMGMEITANRIAMLQQQQNNSYIRINDLSLPDGSPGGTEVILKIPVHYD